MTNSLSDLNHHLFAQLDRLTGDGMTADQIDAEVKRAEAIVAVADQITEIAALGIKAATIYSSADDRARSTILPMLPQIGRTSRTIKGDKA